jgi:hypothetical protein
MTRKVQFIFRNSKIENISYYGREGFEVNGRKEGFVSGTGLLFENAIPHSSVCQNVF